VTELTGVAKRVHDRILAASSVEEAALYARMVVGVGLASDLIEHHDVLQDRVDQIVTKRVELAKRAIVRSAVSKRMAGQEINHLLGAAQVIAKADFREDRVKRNEKGQFSRVESRRRITYNTQAPLLPRKHAEAIGVPSGKDLGSLQRKDAAAYQQAYSQVAQMVQPYAQTGLSGDSVLHLTYRKGNGQTETRTMDMPRVIDNGRMSDFHLDENAFKDGGRLVDATVATNPTLSVQGAAFDLVGQLGGPRSGLVAANTLGSRNPNTGQFDAASEMGSFAQDWNKLEAGDPRSSIYRRLGAGSKLLTSVLGPVLPTQARMALDTADFVSQFGPQAEKVIGPHADRAAYRYRGVERTPNKGLQTAVDGIRAKYRNKLGISEAQRDEAARRELIYGTVATQVTGRGGNERGRAVAVPSPLVAYLQRTLPDANLIHLQRMSGTIPPSQGIIIDRNGKVITEAVGFGEDWYLPFNLKNLSKLKGGEYIRTRAFGGPTTEDIYAGLVSGARAVTVVSHNGVYTIEFDDAFRGSRRYSDKAARMVKRYGQLLDAVKSRQVTLEGIPATRMAELEDRAAQYASPEFEKTAYRDKLNELVTAERSNPQMSTADRNALAVQFLEDRSAEMTGDHRAWPEIAAQIQQRRVAQMRATSSPFDGFDEADARRAAGAGLTSPTGVIAALGPDAERSWANYLDTKTAEYKAAQSPLNLDGVGYAKSMDALKEQFPYYIESVHFTPNRLGGTDFGYIKPRHTRPARVAEGYFDPSINGSSKVRADTIRHQGMDRGPKRFDDEERPQDGGRTSITPSDGGGPKLPEQVREAKEREDVLALHRELAAKKAEPMQFGNLAGNVIDARGAAMLPMSFGQSEEQIKRAYAADPKRVRQGLLAEADKLKQFYTVDSALTDKVRDPSGAAVDKPWRYLDAVDNPNATFDFGEAFKAGHTPDSYAARGEALLKQLGLPDANFGDPAATNAALDGFIKTQHEKFLAAGQPGLRINVEQVERDTKKAVMVKQLLRRYEKALQLEDAKLDQSTSAPTQPNVMMFNLRPDDPLADQLKRGDLSGLNGVFSQATPDDIINGRR
jgi:hypothetical protein